ncbi:MAG: malonyl-CoA decarboxylase [Gammaproteobacteria bacterium]|nr:malonyl-CoA decarboxylase [Gammaproteobacteria bacterium]
MAGSYFSDLLSTIAERGRSLLGLDTPADAARQASGLVGLCEQLLSGRGEASGVALAREVLDRFATLDAVARLGFFTALAERFGPDRERLDRAVTAWREHHDERRAADLHFGSEPRRQELLRRLNRAPGGTAALVAMREALLADARGNPALQEIDRDFLHLLASWFNRGFLVLERVDWSSPALVLEKIIRYEAVHEIHDWDDLRRRIDPVDRRCYAFFHPALVAEPLIFVEVALTTAIPVAIQPLLAADRDPVAPQAARTAVFYSISNCQQGLAGVSFGNFLIKQVAEELRRELPKLETFVTLSPVPGLMRWLHEVVQPALGADDRALLAALDEPRWIDDAELAQRIRRLVEPRTAQYFLESRDDKGRALDPVARFHLGNGARLERINWLGDQSAKALAQSAGVMVNYLYDLAEIERNHEAYANQGDVVAAAQVRKLLRAVPRKKTGAQPA